jgi:uncharacterized membrane protein YGL010W
MQTSALSVVQLVGHTLVVFLRSVGAFLDSLIGSVVDSPAQIIIVLGTHTACNSQE